MTVRSPSFLKAVAVPSRRRFVRFMRRSFVKMAVAAACAGLVVPLFSARAGDPPVPAANTPGATIISTSHRFLVSGMSSAENAALATAAEDVADRIESVMGRRMPFQRGQTLQLSVRYQEDNPRSQVIKAQGWVDRQLAQKLVIINPATADQEDILEGLTAAAADGRTGPAAGRGPRGGRRARGAVQGQRPPGARPAAARAAT